MLSEPQAVFPHRLSQYFGLASQAPPESHYWQEASLHLLYPVQAALPQVLPQASAPLPELLPVSRSAQPAILLSVWVPVRDPVFRRRQFRHRPVREV